MLWANFSHGHSFGQDGTVKCRPAGHSAAKLGSTDACAMHYKPRAAISSPHTRPGHNIFRSIPVGPRHFFSRLVYQYLACRYPGPHPDTVGGGVTPPIAVTCAMRDRPSGAVQRDETARMESPHFDASSDPARTSDESRRNRPFLGVHFTCCGIYARIYLDSKRTRYVGYCPKCCRRIEFRVGPGGTNDRFFTAY